MIIPRHTLQLQRREQFKGSAGQMELRNVGEPVTVRGTFHPLSPSEATNFGIITDEAGTWFCKAWPGDMFCRITFRGTEWDQLNPAQTLDIGTMTRHIEVVIKKRGSHG